MAAVSRTRVAPPVAVTTVVRRAASDIAVVTSAESTTVPERENSGDEEPDDVDDSQRPSSLEHNTRLRRSPVDTRSRDSHFTDTGGPAITERDVGAIRIGDSTEVVDSSDKSANEAEVDECDEAGVCG